MMQTQLMMFVISAACSLAAAHIGGGGIALQDVRPQVYCGRSLSRALALICYDDESIEKRSDADAMYNSGLAPYYKDRDSWPWLAPHRARTMAGPHRGKRFVVTECCEKACSVSELLTYC